MVFAGCKPVGWAEHGALASARATFRVGKTGCDKVGLPEGQAQRIKVKLTRRLALPSPLV
jgi:hypothetical protein